MLKTDSATEEEIEGAPAPPRPNGFRTNVRRLAVVAILCTLVAATIIDVVLWNRHSDVRRSDELSQQYLQAARQGVLDLTSISADTVDADTARVLNASTGTFADEFRSRITDFASVVKQADVTAVGSITEAGIETMNNDSATALVAATSKVTNSAGAQEEPRVWRLRVTLANQDGNVLISNVEFVP
ncbi:hypothetical protein ACNHUS_05900 [Actinomycetes bacterium M1A6_2h]